MSYLIITILSIFVGLFLFPFLLFLRARRADNWDDSNITNIFRVLAHLATHPADFALFQYPDGKKPFWYLSKDEITDIVTSRPNK